MKLFKKKKVKERISSFKKQHYNDEEIVSTLINDCNNEYLSVEEIQFILQHIREMSIYEIRLNELKAKFIDKESGIVKKFRLKRDINLLKGTKVGLDINKNIIIKKEWSSGLVEEVKYKRILTDSLNWLGCDKGDLIEYENQLWVIKKGDKNNFIITDECIKLHPDWFEDVELKQII